jgi:hypothetical protein
MCARGVVLYAARVLWIIRGSNGRSIIFYYTCKTTAAWRIEERLSGPSWRRGLSYWQPFGKNYENAIMTQD